VSEVLFNFVGTIDLLDLDVISEYYGGDFLPYPFMHTRPSRFATESEALAYTRTVPDRFNHGDLYQFTECVNAYAAADVRVECHVQYIPSDTPSVRVMAYRRRKYGYFTIQRTDADAIDVYTVSPQNLGAAICEAVSLTEPGRHPRIVVPEYAPPLRADFDTDDFDTDDFIVRDRGVRHSVDSPAEVTISARDVTAYATVQSHWRPKRKWGLDYGKSAVIWTRVSDDGEYIYVPDFSHARPMTKLALNERIDELIDHDIAMARKVGRE